MRKTSEELFWEGVNKTDGCWLWEKYKCIKGYGKFAARENGKQVSYKTHRYSWRITYGEIPDGLLVCHKCDVRHCVNPEHLFLGTSKDNFYDMIAKGRWNKNHNPDFVKYEIKGKPIGENKAGAKLKEYQIREIRNNFNKKTCNCKHLASIYKVHPRTIQGIINRESWAHVI